MIARIVFWIMLSIVILSELMFAILVDVLGNRDMLGSLLKTVGIITFSILVYKGFKWPKWILGIFSFLYALAMILAGIENSAAFKNGVNVFYVLCGVFFLYGILIFVLPKYLMRKEIVL